MFLKVARNTLLALKYNLNSLPGSVDNLIETKLFDTNQNIFWNFFNKETNKSSYFKQESNHYCLALQNTQLILLFNAVFSSENSFSVKKNMIFRN